MCILIKIENNFFYFIKMMRSNNVVIVRKYLFEKDFICKVYEIESFMIFF